MSETFAEKLQFLLKALSLTRSHLAAELPVDKSIVGRWATGKAVPSGYNMSRLTAMVAARCGRFTMLDWDRPLPEIALLLGVEQPPATLPLPTDAFGLPVVGQSAAAAEDRADTLARRGPSYEGIYRDLRPFSDRAGRFVQALTMVRLERDGLIARTWSSPSHCGIARFIPIRSQIFFHGTDLASALPFFGMIYGSNGAKVMRYDGLLMYAAHDAAYTPFATPFVSERILDLTGDREADDALFESVRQKAGLAPEGSISPEVEAFLLRDIGPAAFALGGDMLLSLPPGRSLALADLPPVAGEWRPLARVRTDEPAELRHDRLPGRGQDTSVALARVTPGGLPSCREKSDAGL